MASAAANTEMMFAPEGDEPMHGGFTLPWKVLIVDDEPGIHEITKLALSRFEFDGRPLKFLHAYTGVEGERLLRENPDTALAMIDVVMENEHAGLDLVRLIREQLKNHLIRIVLRTGQPGQAPERIVIRDYDINDYKEKTELSSRKLYSTVLTSLRSYRDLAALEANRRGLERVISASSEIFGSSNLSHFIHGVLEQLIALLYLDADSTHVNCDSLALEQTEEGMKILAASGQFAEMVGKDPRHVLPRATFALISEGLEKQESFTREGIYLGYFQVAPGRKDILYVASAHPFSPEHLSLVRLFCQNAAIAYDNAILHDEIEGTQRDIVYMLGEAIETRSRETGQHVHRVADYCHLIALGIGLSAREAEVLRLASPLHDFGKIGIPDHILHKPGELDAEEWVLMKRHAEIGRELLVGSSREILCAAAIISGQHHEKWDGSGYPSGLKGEEIHLYGRIAAVADVFDALGSERFYKVAWPDEAIFDYFIAERGRHFDPALVDWLLENREQILAIRSQLPGK